MGCGMTWEVVTVRHFDKWFHQQTSAMQEDILAIMLILSEYGPSLGRPYVDTVKMSDYSNMKELRIQHQGNPVRAFFAFDPTRKAVVLCAGVKTGVNQKQFYQQMIRNADAEFRQYLHNLENK